MPRGGLVITEDVFRRCYRFVIDTALTLGAEDYDFDAWAARQLLREANQSGASEASTKAFPHYHRKWRPGQAEIAAAGARTAGPPKGAAAPMDQSREAHLAAWPLYSPEGGQKPTVARPARSPGSRGL